MFDRHMSVNTAQIMFFTGHLQRRSTERVPRISKILTRLAAPWFQLQVQIAFVCVWAQTSFAITTQ